MANIGDVLSSSEVGMKRYKGIDMGRDGPWQIDGAKIYTTKPDCSCFFNFTGNKLYVLGFCRTNGTYDSNISIYIDKELYSYNAGISNGGNYVLMYKNIDLHNGIHSVLMKNENFKSSSPWWQIMCIDINDTGALKLYDPVLEKYLLKSDNNYYSIKEEFYNSDTGKYTPLLINNPQISDFDNNGMDDLSLITPNNINDFINNKYNVAMLI